MQYKEGSRAAKKAINICVGSESSIFLAPVNFRLNIPAIIKERAISGIKNNPVLRILVPLEVVNSNFSLSKVKYEVHLRSNIAPGRVNQNIIPPRGCGITRPAVHAKNKRNANTTFQKLSLLSLEAIKPVCLLAEFCSSIALLSFSVLQNVLKSSMKTYRNYCFKTYSFIISNSYHILKQIIWNIREFLNKFYKNIVNITSLLYYSGITITYRYKTMRDILLNVRTDTATKELLKEAAAMLGTTVTGFLLSTATKEAHELINNKHHFFLNNEQWNKFCSALDENPKENKALQKLLSTKGIFDE